MSIRSPQHRALPFACALLALAAFSTAQAPLFSVPDAPAPQELGSGRPLVVDLDGDGDQDVVLEVADGFRIWHMDAGSRRYREVQFLEQGRVAAPGFSRTVLLDIDGDGDTDLLTGDLDPAVFALRAYANDGEGRFAAATNVSLPGGEFALPLALHDLDGDGSPEDFAATEVCDRLRLPGAETVASGSLRAPGSRDLVLLRSDEFHDLARVRQMLVFDRIDGQVTPGPLVPDLGVGFQTPRTLQLSFCKSIDLDNDGRDELLVDGYESLNRPSGFLVDAIDPTSFPNTFLGAPNWPSDLDHDGDLDLIGVGSTRENRNGVWVVSTARRRSTAASRHSRPSVERRVRSPTSSCRRRAVTRVSRYVPRPSGSSRSAARRTADRARALARLVPAGECHKAVPAVDSAHGRGSSPATKDHGARRASWRSGGASGRGVLDGHDRPAAGRAALGHGLGSPRQERIGGR